MQGGSPGTGAAQVENRLRAAAPLDLGQFLGRKIQGFVPACLSKTPRTARSGSDKGLQNPVRRVGHIGGPETFDATLKPPPAQRIVADADKPAVPEMSQQGTPAAAIQGAGDRDRAVGDFVFHLSSLVPVGLDRRLIAD